MRTPLDLSAVRLLPLTRALRASKPGDAFVSFYSQRNTYTQVMRLGARATLRDILLVVPGVEPAVRKGCLVLVTAAPEPARKRGRRPGPRVTITVQGARRMKRATLRAVGAALAAVAKQEMAKR